MTSPFTPEDFLSTEAFAHASIEPISICLITSNAFFAQMLLAIRSIQRVYIKAHFFIVLADKAKDKKALEKLLPASSVLIEAHELGISDFTGMAFSYSSYEFACALKPFALEYILHLCQTQHILYCDNDLLFFSPLIELESMLEKSCIALTPQRLTPTKPYNQFREQFIHQRGLFNAGFVALNASLCETKTWLNWWQDHLINNGHTYTMLSSCGDQKWLDQLIVFYPQLNIIKHPGYNIALWNIDERHCSFAQTLPTVNDQPLRFLHLSYIDLRPGGYIMCSSKWNEPHIDIFENKMGCVVEPYRKALQNLLKESGMPSMQAENAYNFYANSVPIPTENRRIYSLTRERFQNKDPFTLCNADFIFNN
jgi:hypothetical protein